MEFKQFVEEAKALDPNKKRLISQILMLVSVANQIRPIYAEHLEAAASATEFFESVYMDDALRMEMAWAKIALCFHSDDFFERFEIIDSYDVPVSGGQFTLSDAKNSISVSVACEGDTAHVRVFEDGVLNETLFTDSKQLGFATECGGRAYPPPMSLHSHGNTVALIPWELNEMGERASTAKRPL